MNDFLNMFCIDTVVILFSKFYDEIDHFGNLDTCKGKGKAVPLQAWCGLEGSRKLRFPDFMTTAQDGSRLSALRTGHLYP